MFQSAHVPSFLGFYLFILNIGMELITLLSLLRAIFSDRRVWFLFMHLCVCAHTCMCTCPNIDEEQCLNLGCPFLINLHVRRTWLSNTHASGIWFHTCTWERALWTWNVIENAAGKLKHCYCFSSETLLCNFW